MRAIFSVPFPHEQRLPMGELHYMDGKVLKGGYSCIGQVGKEATVIVAVEASAEAIENMKKSYKVLESDTDTAITDAKVKPEEYERGKAWITETLELHA